MIRYIFLLIVIGFPWSHFSQNEASKWYFGNQAGLDFMTSPPTILTNGQINTTEGCASISDASGNLLFYTDGVTIYNSLHAVMANGTGLSGNASSTQSGIIVKQPGSSTIYFVFTQWPSSGVKYSIVDMTLAAGLGSVTVKNVQLTSPTTTEKLTAVRHCNGTDVWVLTHDNSNNFLAYQVTASGVGTTAVTSAIGSIHTSGLGHMKAAPNGQRIAMGIYGINKFELYDFDNSTGVVSNSLTLASHNFPYGVEFSPDGTKLYGSVELGGTPTLSIYQWNLCAGSPTAVVASMTVIGSGGGAQEHGAMQLGPDGKIYVARYITSSLGVINSPNLAGTACNYVALGQSVSPKQCRLGLPNFTSSFFKAVPPPFTYTVSNGFGCQTASFTPPFTVQTFTTQSCVSTGYSLTAMQWDFGDPFSGSSNTSTATNPQHIYTAVGSYSVKLILYYSCGGGTDTIKQTVNITQPCISVTSSSITCGNLGSATVVPTNGAGPFTYTWIPTNQTGSVAVGLQPGAYTLSVFNPTTNSTFTTNLFLAPLVPLTGTILMTPSVACFAAANGTGAVTNLSGGSGQEFYSWSNGIVNFTTSTVNSLSSGIWTVTVTDKLTACQIKQTFYITQPGAINFTVAASTPSACVNSSIGLSAGAIGGSGGFSYSWINGPATNTWNVTSALASTPLYTASATDANSCVKTETVMVTFVGNPTITIPTVSICPLQSGTLLASGATTYTWSNNSVVNPLVQAPMSTTVYSVTGNHLGCVSTATALIVLLPEPVPVFGSNSPVCAGQKLLLQASGGNSYVWSGPNGFLSALSNPTLSPATVAHSGNYHFTVTAVNGCTASTSSNVTVHPVPVLGSAGSTVCTTQTASLSANGPPGASYSWKGPVGFNSLLQNPSISSPAIQNSGNYTVVVLSAEGCTNQSIANVSVILPPTLSMILSSNTVCARSFHGSRDTISILPGGAITHTLYAPSFIINTQPSASPIKVQVNPVIPNLLTSSFFTLEGSNGICTSTTSLAFTVRPNPVVTVVPPYAEVCAGKQQTFTPQGASNYYWPAGQGGLSVKSGGSYAVANSNTTSVYSVYGADSGCYSSSVTMTLTVHPLPTLFIDKPKSSICLHDTVLLTATGTSTLFNWSPLHGLYNAAANPMRVSPTATQIYTIVGTANNCTTATQVTVTVRSLPEPVILLTPSIVCAGETLEFTGQGGVQYAWYGPNNFYKQGENVSLKTTGAVNSGNYTLVAMDGTSCRNSVVAQAVVHELPQGYLSGFVQDQCAPYCTTLSFIPNGSLVRADRLSIGDHVLTLPSAFCFYHPGEYLLDVRMIDDHTGCRNTTTVNLMVRDKPIAAFGFDPPSPVEGLDEIRFSDHTESSVRSNSEWYLYDGEKPGRFGKGETFTHTFEHEGFYPVALIAVNEFFCTDTVIKEIKVLPDFSIYVPNAFTPNGDDQNDVFLPVVRHARQYQLIVYNRWGERLFVTGNPLEGWDGTFKNMSCKNDVYSWQINLTTNSGTKKEYIGYVNLLR